MHRAATLVLVFHFWPIALTQFARDAASAQRDRSEYDLPD
jgi:hypothetical protein